VKPHLRTLPVKLAPVAEPKPAAPKPTSKKKLGYNEQRELDGMEANIHRNEERLKTLSEESEDPALATNAKRLTEISKAMGELQDEISRLYARWAELEKS
jgi:ATP-binding cassette subfamily F protein uup